MPVLESVLLTEDEKQALLLLQQALSACKEAKINIHSVITYDVLILPTNTNKPLIGIL